MALRKNVTAEVDPISRIEGHLGVKLTTDATTGKVTEANVHGNLWRGFENFLLHRNANDAITFTQRICGVCPVPHGQTSTYAVDAVLGYSRGHITFAWDGTNGVPAKAVHIRNLVLSAEFLMSNLTHFYHLVALDYVQGPATPPWTPYFADSFYHALLLNPTSVSYAGTSTSAGALPSQDQGFSEGLWDAAVTQYVKALRIRRLTFEAGALFAGRMPMTSCFVGGGVTNDGTEDLSDRCETYKTIMNEVGEFIIKEHVPLVLALGALYPNYDNLNNATTLNAAYSALWTLGNKADSSWGTTPVADNTGWGAGWGNFVAWGAFPVPGTDELGLPGGVIAAPDWSFQACNKGEIYDTFLGDDTSVQDRSMATNLTESIAYSRYEVSSFDTDAYVYDSNTAAKPGEVKRTAPNRGNGYSYIKSPRWDGYPCEVGPFARMRVCGQYPADGVTFASTVTGYGAYTKAGPLGTTGLNPAMIYADLAVALVREGLAAVDISGTLYASASNFLGDYSLGLGTGDIDTDTDGAPNATLLTVYTDPDAVIVGAVKDWVILLEGGLSTMDRIRARAIESLFLVQKMIGTYTPGATGGSIGTWGSGWIDDLDSITGGVGQDTVGSTWRDKNPPTTAMSGYGATEAPRGALAHFASTNAAGKLTAYQCVVPTTWNASPKDGADKNGPMEQAMMNIPFDDAGASFTSIDGTTTVNAQAGIEALRVAHTFDPCIACAVH